MELWEVQLFISGHRKSEEQLWKVGRQHAFWVLKSLGSSITSSSDLLPLPSDKEYHNEQVSEDDIKAAIDLINGENAK